MTILRWLAFILVGVLLVGALFIALAFLRLNSGLLNPGYYPELLKKADVYRFATEDVVSSALDEARALDPDDFGADFHDNPLVASGLTTQQIRDAVGRALSPDDLEALVAPAVLQVGEYVAGQRDEINVTVDAAPHVRALVDELETLLRENDAYGALLDREVYPRIRDAVREAREGAGEPSGWMRLIFGTGDEAEERIIQAVQGAVTPEWSALQVERGLDEVTPYLLGESDTFEVRVGLTDLQASAAAEVASILREADAHEIAFTGVLEPELEKRLGDTVTLSYGIEVARQEIVDTLRRSLSPTDVQRQVEPVIDEVSDYLTGRSDEFSTQVSLFQGKREAATALTSLSVAKLDQALRGLPICATEADARRARDMLAQTLSSCLPSDLTASEVASQARPGIAESVQDVAMTPVPDTIVFTEADLRSALVRSGGQAALDSFDDLRGILDEDWTYTHDDLREELSEDGFTAIDEARSFLADGYAHPKDDPDELGEALDEARQSFGDSMRFGWVAYVIAAVLLVILGALGGGRWSGRAAWAALVLFIAAVLVFILSWPVYGGLADPAFDEARAEILEEATGDFAGTASLVGNKVVDIAQTAGDDFATGVRWVSLYVAIGALAALLIAIFWDLIGNFVRGSPRSRTPSRNRKDDQAPPAIEG